MWNKCTKCGIFVDNNSRCGQNAAAFCVGEQPHRRSTKKAARGRSMRVSPTQSRKGSRDNVPCRVQGQRPCWGLGQRPNSRSCRPLCQTRSSMPPLVAGSEASLRTNSRVRRRGIPLPLIILFSNSPAPSACAFSFGNSINSPLSGHPTRAGAFLSPMEEHSHD